MKLHDFSKLRGYRPLCSLRRHPGYQGQPAVQKSELEAKKGPKSPLTIGRMTSYNPGHCERQVTQWFNKLARLNGADWRKHVNSSKLTNGADENTNQQRAVRA